MSIPGHQSFCTSDIIIHYRRLNVQRWKTCLATPLHWFDVSQLSIYFVLLIICGEKLLLLHVFTFISKRLLWLPAFTSLRSIHVQKFAVVNHSTKTCKFITTNNEQYMVSQSSIGLYRMKSVAANLKRQVASLTTTFEIASVAVAVKVKTGHHPLSLQVSNVSTHLHV